MNINDLKTNHPTVEFKVDSRSIVATCNCGQQPSTHKRLFAFDALNDATLAVIDRDLQKHDQSKEKGHMC